MRANPDAIAAPLGRRLGRGSALLVHGTGQFRQLRLRDAVRQRARRPHEVSVLVELHFF